MYIDTIRIENFRTFRMAEIDLLHPQRTKRELTEKFNLSPVLYPNINLILGNNGLGKSSFLMALALACLGPVVTEVRPNRFVRREPGASEMIKRDLKRVRGKVPDMPSTRSIIKGVFVPNRQDDVAKSVKRIDSRIRIDRRDAFEQSRYLDKVGKEWHPIYNEDSDALFFVGYGANRRSEDKERFDPSTRRKSAVVRARRVMSLFDESYSLVPLAAWLPLVESKDKTRYAQVATLLRSIVGEGHWRFTGEMESGEYLFQRGDQKVPYPALSDGYRAFYGWLGDLLHHVCDTATPGKTMVQNQGMVMIDEIDLHLHPSWQMEVLPRLSKELPNIQFIVTSHSPLVVGSLQWVNLIVLEPADAQSTTLVRKEIPVHGLDADQVLVTPFFGLNTSRVGDKAARLKDLSSRASEGDRRAASQLLREMSQGSEVAPAGPAPGE
jgi:predicted ATPase